MFIDSLAMRLYDLESARLWECGDSNPYLHCDYQRGVDNLTPGQSVALCRATDKEIGDLISLAGDRYEDLPSNDLGSAIMVIMSNLEI